LARSSILLLTAANPPGERQLSIAFSSTELSLVLAGGLLLLIGQALGAGASAADENRAFV